MKTTYKILHYVSKINMYLLVYFVIAFTIKLVTFFILKSLDFQKIVIFETFYLDEIIILVASLIVVLRLLKNKSIEISSPYEKYIH